MWKCHFSKRQMRRSAPICRSTSLLWTTSRWPSEIDPLRGLSLSTRYLIKIFDSRRVSFSIKLWQRPSLIVKGQLWPKYSLKLTCGHSISFNVQDSTGHIGFQFKDGKITSIVVDSSAARFLTPSRTQFCNFPHKYFYPLLKYFHLEGTGSLLTTSCWRWMVKTWWVWKTKR